MEHAQEPILTEAAREALGLGAGSAYGALVPARPNQAARQVLQRLNQQGVVMGAKSRLADRAALAGLWLWHDFLPESHTISQSIETPEGSFWHAIMHRREGDFSNAKYWLRRVGTHDTFARIASEGGDFIDRNKYAAPLSPLVEHQWDAAGFVDVCEELHRHPDDPRHKAAIELQRIEWSVLFHHCARHAAG